MLLQLRNRHYLLLDCVLLLFTPALALGLRVDLDSFAKWLPGLMVFTAAALAAKLPTFYFFGLYRRFWRYAGLDEAVNIVFAAGVAMVVATGLYLVLDVSGVLSFDATVPRSIPVLDALMTILVVGGTRFAIRLAGYARQRYGHHAPAERALIVGAGDAGTLIARDLMTRRASGLDLVGFVDDDREKQGMRIVGLPVLGLSAQLGDLLPLLDIQLVIIAMPSAAGAAIREIVRVCEAAGVACKTLPGVSELLSGHVTVSSLRNISIEDLLRREPIHIDREQVNQMVAGKRVLVTGAGGSIGSELCRQIAQCCPGQLVALGHGENSLFELSYQLGQLPPCADGPLNLALVVADIRDRARLEGVFARFRPEIVFHAAAHKHVPLMEINLEDAVTNNILGTRNVAEVAEQSGVERLVLISTDKAVNPANVMGVTKRVAGLIVGEVARRARRPYVVVRFGNVLGSRGSVVPLFRQQIQNGGPVTLTHPDIKRFFMTIPEAVELVLQAAALGRNGEVFVLDMGEPIRIADLARDLIKLSGLEEGRDIEIVYTGLRPGEKMTEELFLPDEAPERTQHPSILMARHGQGRTDGTTFWENVERLIAAAHRSDQAEMQGLLKTLVPEYVPYQAAAETATSASPGYPMSVEASPDQRMTDSA